MLNLTKALRQLLFKIYDMIPLECLRLGLRGDTFFEYLPKKVEERLKQVNDDDDVEEDV